MTKTTTMAKTKSPRATSNFEARVLRPRRRKQRKLKPTRNLPKISISRASRVPNHDTDSIESDRVVVSDANDDAEPCSSMDPDELGLGGSRFGSSQDLVWAKAYPNAWWPGCVTREVDGRVLVSFFGTRRRVWVALPETRGFEGEFALMVGREGGRRLDSGAVDSALEEFSHRLTLELSCSCQDNLEDGRYREELEGKGKGKVHVDEAFRPVEALGFARDIAVSQSFDKVDSVSVFRAAAQVNAFRRFAFLQRDWIYEETMRLSEADGDSEEEMMSTCSEDEISCVVAQDMEFGTEEELEDVVKEDLGGEEENEVDNDNGCVWQENIIIDIEDTCSEDLNDEITSVASDDMDLEDGEHECDVGDTNYENGEGECEENVKPIKQGPANEKSHIMVQGIFNPVEVLAFVQRMALAPWADDADTLGVIRAAACVKKFRRHTFIKQDWIYHETMSLSYSTSETDCNMDGVSSVHKKIQKVNFSVDGGNIHSQSTNPVQIGSTACNKASEDPPHDILKQLYCLAVDPFLRSKWYGVRDSNYVCREILRYRELLYKKVTDIPQPIKGTSYNDKEISEVQTFLKASPTTNPSNLSVNVPVKENIVANGNRSQSSLFLSDSWGRRSKKDGDEVKDCDRRSNVEDVIEPVQKDIGLARGSNKFNDDFENNKVQKIRDINDSSSSSNVEGRKTVENQRDILVCYQKTEDKMVSQTNNTRHTGDMDICRSTTDFQGRDVSNIQRDIPTCASEYQSSKRQETEDRKVCMSNKREKNMDAAVKCDISNVEGGNVVGLQRDVPKCNGEYKSNKRQKTEDINVFRTSQVNRVNVFNGVRDTHYNCVNKRQKTDDVRIHNTCNGHFESNTCQKVSASDPVLNFQGQNTKALPGGISASSINDSDESKTSSHVLKDHLKSKHGSEASTSGKNVDLKVCKSNGMLNTLPGEAKSQEISSALCDDRTNFPSTRRPSSSHLSHRSIDMHHSSGTDADIINKELNVRIVSGGCHEINRSQHTVDISVKFQQSKTLMPLTMLYSSPLSAASSDPIGLQCESSKTLTHSDNPTTLHMKFPKDFKLPSKEELVNKFRPFGPIDLLKTKVFFYTGSAQIVFLHYLDAESACHNAKKKNIFLGEANIRFWIDQHEHLRRGTTKTTPPASLLTAGSSISTVKSCLKISKGINSERKHLHVKFPSDNEDFPSDTIEKKQFTCADVPKCGKEVGPDISQQMSALLERCDQTVNEIKNTLGIQSYYSLFSQIL